MKLALNDSSLLQTQAFINGEWVDGEKGETFAVTNPATGELLANVASVGKAETTQAIDAAEVAMKSWKALPPAKRSEVLECWHGLIIDNIDDLAAIMTIEQGKPLFESKGEVMYGASYLKWFAEEGKRIYGDVLPSTADRRSIVIRQPVGVVAAITPWNFPNAMITRKAAPALAAGCAIVLKPAAETPLSALALAELAKRAGLPNGLFSVLPSADAPAVGGEMTANVKVKKLTFTGSTPVGKLLMKQCADTVKRTSMELGGNAPVIIFDDADIDEAIKGALISKYRNSGQTCICANRLLVQEGIYDAFVEKFIAQTRALRVGSGYDDGTDIGPLINVQATAKVKRLMADAERHGGEFHHGGPVPDDGFFVAPTVITGLSTEAACFHEELFAPVAPVYRFADEAEAIALANGVKAGLSSYLYSNDVGRIYRVAEALEVGVVGINDGTTSHEGAPFGGVKESGQGRGGGHWGLDEYLELKYMNIALSI
jgi:succinate-semialdehyde dehydrogenase/glutarate-semialdehyde dehydrogenase